MDEQHGSLADWDAAIEIWEGTSEETGETFYYLASDWPDEMVAEFAFLRLPLVARRDGLTYHFHLVNGYATYVVEQLYTEPLCVLLRKVTASIDPTVPRPQLELH
jgi:hypothetical protein